MPFYRIFKKNKENHKENHKENGILEFEKNYKENEKILNAQDILEFKIVEYPTYKENEKILNAQDILEFKIVEYPTYEDYKKIINNLNSKHLKIDFTDFLANKFNDESEIYKLNYINLIEFIIETNNIIDLNKVFDCNWTYSGKTTLFLMMITIAEFTLLKHPCIYKKIKELKFNEDLGYGVTSLVHLIAHKRFEPTKFLIQEGAKNFQIKKKTMIYVPLNGGYHHCSVTNLCNYCRFDLNENDTIIEVLKRSKFTNDQKLELSELLIEKNSM